MQQQQPQIAGGKRRARAGWAGAPAAEAAPTLQAVNAAYHASSSDSWATMLDMLPCPLASPANPPTNTQPPGAPAGAAAADAFRPLLPCTCGGRLMHQVRLTMPCCLEATHPTRFSWPGETARCSVCLSWRLSHVVVYPRVHTSPIPCATCDIILVMTTPAPVWCPIPASPCRTAPGCAPVALPAVEGWASSPVPPGRSVDPPAFCGPRVAAMGCCKDTAGQPPCGGRQGCRSSRPHPTPTPPPPVHRSTTLEQPDLLGAARYGLLEVFGGWPNCEGLARRPGPNSPRARCINLTFLLRCLGGFWRLLLAGNTAKPGHE